MLGESFIHLLKYKQEDPHSPHISTAPLNKVFTPPADHCPEAFTVSNMKDIPAPVDKAPLQVKHVDVHQKSEKSVSMAPYSTPDTYFSRYYVSPKRLETSNAQNIPEMQMRSLYESQEFHTDPVNLQDWQTSHMDESIPQQLQLIPQQQATLPDDGYLVMDSSIVMNGEPPTNSMINGYLDRKLQEVYSQYMQERLACPGSSPGCSLLPLLPQPSLLQLDQQVLLGSSPEVRPSPTLTTSGQGHHSQKVSSTFSSPVLRISNIEQSRRPGHSDNL